MKEKNVKGLIEEPTRFMPESTVEESKVKEEALSEDDFKSKLEELMSDIDDVYVSDIYDDGMDFSEFEEKVESSIQKNSDIIYYSTAMNFLMENDSSLNRSVGIAAEMGIETENINSELLASLLNNELNTEAWQEVRDDVEALFEDRDEDDE